MRKWFLILGLFMYALPVHAGGTIITDGFVSNFVSKSPDGPEDDPRRLFNVYLPAAFFENPTETFPIVYHLPAFGAQLGFYNAPDRRVLDRLISEGQIVPMVVVIIDDRTFMYTGGWYVNSELQGLYERYFLEELIPYVNAKYRQKTTVGGDTRPFRALMGHSMGGQGSLFYGIKFPNLFTAFAGNSPTGFHVIETALAAPDGNPAFAMNKLIIPELANNPEGEVNPFNGDFTFSVFSYAGAFSPNLDKPFEVDLPFLVTPDLRPIFNDGSLILDNAVIARWKNFTPYFLLDKANLETLRRRAIFFTAGDAIDPVNNVGAHYLSEKMIDLNIDHEYLLYRGNHTTCVTNSTAPRDLRCYQFLTDLKMFSAKFSEAGAFADDIRTKIVGMQTIEVADNAVFSINDKALVGIETSQALGITDTAVTIRVIDNGRFEIGNKVTLGGGLQVGNTFGKANLLHDPSLVQHTISCTIVVDGPGAVFNIGRQGFLGFGVGLDGNRTTQPNFWGVSTLTNVTNIFLDIRRGQFIHNQIASSLDPKAALLALGEVSSGYSLVFNPRLAVIAGGANLAKVIDGRLMHPTVQDFAGEINPEGIRLLTAENPPRFDDFFGPPRGLIGTRTVYSNQLEVSILSSSLGDRAIALFRITAERFFDILKAQDYLNQRVKSASISNLNGNLKLGFITDTNQIQRPTFTPTPVCEGIPPLFNRNKILQEGRVGIKLVTVNDEQVVLRAYDLNP